MVPWSTSSMSYAETVRYRLGLGFMSKRASPRSMSICRLVSGPQIRMRESAFRVMVDRVGEVDSSLRADGKSK